MGAYWWSAMLTGAENYWTAEIYTNWILGTGAAYDGIDPTLDQLNGMGLNFVSNIILECIGYLNDAVLWGFMWLSG